MAEDDRVYILGEDVLDPYGGAFKVTKGLSSLYPERVLSTPISEASITGFAVGMALRGLKPVLEIMFGDFITLCTDQIINGAIKFNWMYNNQVEVPLIIRTPMGGRRGYGPTHSQTLETLFLNVPNLSIVAPSHYHNPGDLLSISIQRTKNPLLFIENKILYPQKLIYADDKGWNDDVHIQTTSNHHDDYPSISVCPIKGEPPDVTLICYGGMAQLAIEAIKKVFMQEEIVVEVIIPSLIKPFPLKDILPSVYRSGKVVIAEEGVMTSGWGAEMAAKITESAFERMSKPVKRIGAKELPIPCSKSLEEKVLPQIKDIELAIYQIMEN